jgi:hypothetical protein
MLTIYCWYLLSLAQLLQLDDFENFDVVDDTVAKDE